MSEYHDLSELPRDEAYWQDLESRVVGGLRTAGEGAPGRTSWLQPIAKRATGLGWLAAAGLAALLLTSGRPEERSGPLPFLHWPDEPIANAFLAASPPALASILISASVEAR